MEKTATNRRGIPTGPRRMTPAAVLIKTWKQFRALLITVAGTAIIKEFSNGGEHRLYILAVLGALMLVILSSGVLSYLKCTYWVEEGKLMFRHGILNRKTDFIPLGNIHSLRTNRGPVYRLLQMRGIVFDTLASRYEEIELILDETDWKTLLGAIGTEEKQKDPRKEDLTEEIPAGDTEKIIRVPNMNIIRGALCQNHLRGFALLAVSAGAFLNQIMSISDKILKRAVDTAAGYAESLTATFTGIFLTALLLYILMILLWTAKNLLVYANLEIRVKGDSLTVECGLLSRNSARLPRHKVCALQIKRNPLEKRMNVSTIRLFQAANVGDRENRLGKLGITLYGSDMAPFFTAWWLGEDAEDTKGAETGGIPDFHAHFFTPAGIISRCLSTITLCTPCIRIDAGVLARKRTLLRYNAIQELKLRRTPLSTYTRRGSLGIATSGPTFRLFSISLTQAAPLYDRILLRGLIKSRTRD